MIRELEQWAAHGVDFITIADDNLVGDRAYCRQMLRAVGDWNRARAVPVSLYAEMSVDAVRDPELLELCRHANITEIFLGIETPRKAGLRETLKMQNVATDLVQTVKTIQRYGMVTVAGMIIGFDSDDAEIFEDQFTFLQAAGIPIVMLGLLQAIPRTPLYERLDKAGRLRTPVQGNNTLSFTNIEPVCMSYPDLVNGYRTLFTKLYTLDAIGDRWLANVDQWRAATAGASVDSEAARPRAALRRHAGAAHPGVVSRASVSSRVPLPHDRRNAAQVAAGRAPDRQLSRVFHPPQRVRRPCRGEGLAVQLLLRQRRCVAEPIRRRTATGDDRHRGTSHGDARCAPGGDERSRCARIE